MSCLSSAGAPWEGHQKIGKQSVGFFFVLEEYLVNSLF